MSSDYLVGHSRQDCQTANGDQAIKPSIYQGVSNVGGERDQRYKDPRLDFIFDNCNFN